MMHKLALAAYFLIGSTVAESPFQRTKATEDPPGWPLGNFQLKDRSGQIVSKDSLKGKVWVAHFFFTTCTGDCTKTAPVMRQLQQDFAGKPDVQLVSISLNDDSPETLNEYARDMGAVPGQWLFLTGPKKDVHNVVQQSFYHTAMEDPTAKPGQEVNHSPNLLVIDRDGSIYGYVDGRVPEAAAVLRSEIRELASARYGMAFLNAILNGSCGVLLILGYLAIKARREKLHEVMMLAALAVSATFLGCYLYYHFAILGAQPTRFQGEGLVRWLYFGILLSHTILAAIVAPLAIVVAWQGYRDRRSRHVRLARWTLPIWIYVSITGVVVYWMLYHIYPPY